MSVLCFYLECTKSLTIDQKDFLEGGIGMPLDYTVPHKVIYARDPASQPILLNGAIEGHVLVKNVNKTLPLKKPKLISVFGYDAVAPSSVDIQFSPGYSIGFLSRPDFVFTDVIRKYLSPGQIAPNGTLFTGGGSGANAPAYISAPFDALQEQAYKDGTALYWDFTSGNPTVDTASDACLVFINAFATEGVDRDGLHGNFPHPPLFSPLTQIRR
jgi:beta-glucosidase